MKKNFLLLITLLSFVAHSQTQFENSGFETWQNVGAPEEEPTEYSSLKTADALAWAAPVVLSRESTNPHSGSYCARLENKTAAGIVANGLLTNGRVHADWVPANGYVFTNTSDSQWNSAFTVRPDSLVGWFRYDPVGADKGKFEVILHDAPPQGQLPATTYPMAHWVGRARYDVTTDSPSTWVRFSVPFTYYNNNTPDYLLIVMSSGDSTIAVEGSIMWVDDLELIYNPNTVSVTPPATQNINMGVDGATLTVNAVPNAAVVTAITQEWKFTTTSGSGYASFGTAETGTTYTPNFAAAGIYYVVCEVDFGTEVLISNEVEIVVVDPGANSVTISPSAPQSILVGQNGTIISANETPSAASSREWKYSGTSGSGYVSFGTPVTGLTYTPNFSALGTYYVICESDFSGDIQVSNEVTIIVPSAAGINDDNLKFNIYSHNQMIRIMLSDLHPNTYFTLYSLDGKIVHGQTITDEETLVQTNVAGVFVYTLVSGDKVITGKIIL